MRTKWGQQHAGEISKFIAELDDKHLEQHSYDDIMGAEVSEEETDNFFADLKSMFD